MGRTGVCLAAGGLQLYPGPPNSCFIPLSERCVQCSCLTLELLQLRLAKER